ncbi:MAG: hypothetical protein J6K77_07210, partial [Ruminococcus sp.]|nr:hypothetical protein [Ruminococcus sp.]
SAKGALPLLKPGVIGCADLGLCPKPCQRRCLWTLPKGHCPFGNPVFIDLRSIWGAAPCPVIGVIIILY